MSYISKLDPSEVDVLRGYLEGNFKEFSKFCFKILTGQKMMAAEVDGSGDIFRVGAVSERADHVSALSPSPYQYDITPDGQRFLVKIQGDTSIPPLSLVLDFAAELRGRR